MCYCVCVEIQGQLLCKSQFFSFTKRTLRLELRSHIWQQETLHTELPCWSRIEGVLLMIESPKL